MLVLDKPLKGYYPEIDVVTTPCGAPVAMAVSYTHLFFNGYYPSLSGTFSVCADNQAGGAELVRHLIEPVSYTHLLSPMI